jgi:hypothetical protein
MVDFERNKNARRCLLGFRYFKFIYHRISIDLFSAIGFCAIINVVLSFEKNDIANG